MALIDKITLVLMSFSLGVIFGLKWAEAIWEYNLIERGHALYCLDDGNFAFKGECNE